MTKSKRKNDEILQPTFLRFVKYVILVSISLIVPLALMFFCSTTVLMISSHTSDCFMSPCLPDWDDMNDVADYYNFYIPSSASNIKYVNDDADAFFEIHFDLPKNDFDSIRNRTCQGNFQAGYDPSQSKHQFSSEYPTILIKSFEYPFYSHSVDTPTHILGKLCRWDLAIRVDTSNPDIYKITYQRYEYTTTACEVECFTTQRFIKPINNSLFAVSGLIERNDTFYIEFNTLCFDSKMYQIINPTNQYLPAFTQINISIDDMFFLPTGIVTKYHRLVRDYILLDEEDHDLARYQQSPLNEFCIEHDWEQGKHTVNVEMILPDGMIENHSFDFYVD